MALAKEKAKYFCEHCGSEVAVNARFCPKCGKFFSSVRCPQCGFTGDARTFKTGCPKCHYAMPSSDQYGTASSDESKHKLSLKSKKKIKKAFKSQKEKSGDFGVVSDDAPRWLYLLSLLVLALIIVVLVIRCGY